MKKSVIGLVLILCSSCYSDFLNVKPDKRKSVPKSIEDFQALMDNSTDMNYSGGLNLAIISSDEYILSDQQWNVLPTSTERNAYIWAKDIFENEESADWNTSYKRVLYCNIAIEGLSEMDPFLKETPAWKNAMGTALFHRALAFYELAQLFCDIYENGNAPGIPLRVDSDVNLKTPRSTVSQTYIKIVQDLEFCKLLLPDQQAIKERPSRSAAMGLQARAYLQMGEYNKALEMAGSVIQTSDGLMDYSLISPTLSYSFPYRGIDNPEILFMSRISGNLMILNPAMFNIYPELLKLFPDSDYRKKLFFSISQSGNAMFKGSYFGSSPFFTGIALDEMYLIAIEAAIRLNKKNEGVALLESFMKTRYSRFEIPEKLSEIELIQMVLTERKKQLLGRGIYWSDLKRLNLEDRFKYTLIRNLNGVKYELPPNSKKYVLPIPDNAIDMGEIEQNMR